MAPLRRRSVLLGAGALGLVACGIAAHEVAARLGTQGPHLTVTRHEPGTFNGRILFTYNRGAAIADASGTPLWTMSGADSYANFQVQQYRGEGAHLVAGPVLPRLQIRHPLTAHLALDGARRVGRA